jgi:hypothetical protein
MQVDGSATFGYQTEPFNTCVYPANARPFFWSNNNGAGEFDRWWANRDAFVLASGQVTLTVPLIGDRWSSVYGKLGSTDAAASAGFASALSHVSSIGLTFGGGCFFGHGVYLDSGSATFTILNYSVQ